jgi:hypothetical protein
VGSAPVELASPLDPDVPSLVASAVAEIGLLVEPSSDVVSEVDGALVVADALEADDGPGLEVVLDASPPVSSPAGTHWPDSAPENSP